MQRGWRATRRGLTMIEIVVAVGIFALVSSVYLLSTRNAVGRANSRALAMQVAGEFRLARQKAIAQQKPVTVSIPGPVANGLYVLEGETNPQVTRTVSFATEYPGAALTVATWPANGFTRNVHVPASKADRWGVVLKDWIPGRFADDFHFIFTPDGSVITNDLPALDGAYRLVAANGAEVSVGTAPPLDTGATDWIPGGPGYYNLRGAGEPYTVSVSPGGAIEMESGLAGYTGSSVNLVNAVPMRPGDFATTPRPRPLTESAAEIIAMRVLPDKPPGQDVFTLFFGEYLTLEVFGRSGDGRQLYASWDDRPLMHPGDDSFKGEFSCPRPPSGAARDRMEFFPEFDINEDGVIGNNEKDVWRAVWTWVPSPRSDNGDQYSLNLEVTDATGEVLAEIDDPPRVEVNPPGEIVFVSNRDGNQELYTMWADGTHQYRLTYTAADEDYPSVSADGTLIAFERAGEVWIMNVDGTMQSKIANGEKPVISPRGDWIAYKGIGTDTIHVCKTDGSQAASFTGGTSNTLDTTERVSWTRDGEFLLYENGTDIWSYQVDTGNQQVAISHAGTETLKAPWGQFTTGELFFVVGAVTDPYVALYTGPVPPSGYVVPSQGNKWGGGSPGVNETFPTLSPKGDKVLVVLYTTTTNHQIHIYDKFPARANAKQLTNGSNNTRPAWIRQR